MVRLVPLRQNMADDKVDEVSGFPSNISECERCPGARLKATNRGKAQAELTVMMSKLVNRQK